MAHPPRRPTLSPIPYYSIVVFDCNFRSLPLFGLVGFLKKAAKSLLLATLLSAAKIAMPFDEQIQ